MNSRLNTSRSFYLRETSNTNLFSFQNGQLIDIHVIVQGEVFQAHKILLCSASKFLMDRILNLSLSLYPGLRHDLLCLILDNCTSGQFRYILDYIYDGKVDIPEHVSNLTVFLPFLCENNFGKCGVSKILSLTDLILENFSALKNYVKLTKAKFRASKMVK